MQSPHRQSVWQAGFFMSQSVHTRSGFGSGSGASAGAATGRGAGGGGAGGGGLGVEQAHKTSKTVRIIYVYFALATDEEPG